MNYTKLLKIVGLIATGAGTLLLGYYYGFRALMFELVIGMGIFATTFAVLIEELDNIE